MLKRVVGIETEFGCLVRDPSLGPPERVVEAVKEAAFAQRLGLLDIQARSSAFEPARSGGFLINGARLYVDAVGSHEEYATPECAGLRDLAAHEKAGHYLLVSLLDHLGWRERVSFHNNSVDHFGGHTFGCHENYLSRPPRTRGWEYLAYLLPFLATRQIFAGVGRVGGHKLTNNPHAPNLRNIHRHAADYVWLDVVYGVEPDPSVPFQLSQRADHIIHAISGQVRFNRAIINPRGDRSGLGAPRLHLLFGEANMSEYATMLKVGTTCLALTLAEEGALGDDVLIDDPVAALRTISRDQSYRWLVKRLRRGTISAIDLQRIYLRAAQRYAGADEDTDWVLREWEAVLDQLERDPMQLADRLDWVAKRRMLEQYMAETGASWQDDVLHSLDLEYHNLDPEQSLFGALQQDGMMLRLLTEEEIRRAMREPPANTRAAGRALAVRGLLEAGAAYYAIDWGFVAIPHRALLALGDPLAPGVDEAREFLRVYAQEKGA
jgi:proteasome accessory factor A